MNAKTKSRPSGPLTVLAALLCTTLGLAVGPSRGQDARLDDWNVDPIRGPVDLGLTDPSLVGPSTCICMSIRMRPEPAA
jgi:hypothetical protein